MGRLQLISNGYLFDLVADQGSKNYRIFLLVASRAYRSLFSFPLIKYCVVIKKNVKLPEAGVGLDVSSAST